MTLRRRLDTLRGNWRKYRTIPAAPTRRERGICVYDYEMIYWLHKRA